MNCPAGLTWIPDREFCSKCPLDYIWNAEWNECVKMAKVAEPGNYPTSGAAFFGLDLPKSKLPWILGLAFILLLLVR